jgi:phosphatidylserine decarboxylase
MTKQQISAVFYYQNNTLIPERNLAFNTQQWLYRSWFGRLMRQLLKTHTAGALAGRFHASRFSARLISSFIKEYKINMSDFVIPAGGFKSFNDFFMRELQPNARRLPEHKNALISPVDGKLFVVKNVTPKTIFFAKELPFNLPVFLNDQAAATQLNNGTLLMFRLAPYDYHRFHVPCDGIVEKITTIRGALESVNPIAFMLGVQPLTTNERIVILYKTASHGTIAIVAVGALFVGSITLFCRQGSSLKCGDQLGVFAFGGSTVALLFPAGSIMPKEPFLTHSLQGYESAVTMGSAITD